MQYDRIDARILEIVQRNNRPTSEVIGEFAGLSATAERSDIIDRFKKAIKSSAEVVNGFYVTGDADSLT